MRDLYFHEVCELRIQYAEKLHQKADELEEVEEEEQKDDDSDGRRRRR